MDELQLTFHVGDAFQLLAGEVLDEERVGDGRDDVVDPGGDDVGLELIYALLGCSRDRQGIAQLRCREFESTIDVTACKRIGDGLETLVFDSVSLDLTLGHRWDIEGGHDARQLLSQPSSRDRTPR